MSAQKLPRDLFVEIESLARKHNREELLLDIPYMDESALLGVLAHLRRLDLKRDG